MKENNRAPDLPFLALIVCVLLSVTVGQIWLWEREGQIRETWLDEERVSLRRVLQNVRRLSSPETFFPILLRRSVGDLKFGKSLEESFQRFKPWAAGKAEILVFDQDGRRIKIPGFPLDRGAVSEKALRAIREAGQNSDIAVRKLSSSFLGMRTGLEKIAQSGHTMLPLAGSNRYAFGGWWPLSSEMTAGSVASAAVSAPELPADVLILVSRGRIARYELLKQSLASTRRLLKGQGVLKLAVRKSAGPDRPGSAVRANSVRVEERLIFDERIELRLARRVEPRGQVALMVKTFEAARQAMVWAGVLILVLGFRQYRLLSAEQLSLGRMIRLGILGSVVPALILFLTWTIEFLNTSTLTMSWQTHRHLETELDRIDRESEREQRQLSGWLKQLSERLQGVPGPQAEGRVGADLAHCPLVESAYLFESYGALQAVLRRHPSTPESQQAFALSVAVNLTGVMENREPKSINKASYDLSYMKGFIRHLLENIGRIGELEGFGLRRSVFVSFVRDADVGKPARILVVLLSFDSMQQQYLQRCLDNHRRGFWLGLAETGPAGPRRGYPDRLLWNADLLSLCEESHRLKRTMDTRLSLPGRGTFLATAIPGQRMRGYVLVGALPFQPIERQMHLWFGSAVFGLFGVMLMAVGTAVVLAGHLREGLGRITSGLESLQGRLFHLPAVEPDDQLARIYGGIVAAGRTLDELYAAVPVQKTLIFEGEVRRSGFCVSCRHLPGAFLGGDYMDVLELPPDRLMFCLGDSGSKSLAAALLTARVKMAVSLLSEETDDPALIMKGLNELLLGLRFKRRHMSLILGVIHGDGSIVLANAGHCWPLVSVSGKLSWLEERGLPLGSRLREPLTCHTMTLKPGEGLVCYTNGWSKAFDPEYDGLGFDRLQQSVQTHLSLEASALSELLDQHTRLLPLPPEPHEGRSLMIIRREEHP